MQTTDGLSPIVHAAKSEEEQLVMEIASENTDREETGSRVALSDLAPKSSEEDRVDRIACTKKRTYNSIGKSTEAIE